MLSNSIKNADIQVNNHVPSSLDSYGYELIVNDGWLYLYDKCNGQVFKKLDTPDSTWEVIEKNFY